MEASQEADEMKRAVEEDRRLFLQTVIVRVMKSRKSMSHTGLIQEVIEQSHARFVPQVSAIKKSIEQLIEKGYLDRSKEQLDVYDYVA
ncbi:Cullin-2 [Cladochytrium tenue]|nr:Cullin-2 [Cladochytrium tenue]